MSTTDTPVTETENNGNSDKDRNWDQLRTSNENNKQAADKWRTKALETAAQAAGYDITKDVTKLLIQNFEGEDVDADLFKTYATEKGLEPHAIKVQAEQDEQVVTDLERLQTANDQVLGDTTTGVKQPKTVKDQIAEAQQSGDIGAALTAALGEDVVTHFAKATGTQAPST